ncbi:MAG: tripartite tricarboxylate transporter substrate-binding protein [Gammaproteobacteria bacterium]|nr:tripartite tricarboxylate transporter substrate-binding protein [Gammaproteobacteria bacterium]
MNNQNRRLFLKLTAAGLAAAGMPALSYGAGFPERTIKVFIPTRAGGGADRNFRNFGGVWKDYLGVELEPSFYPGAAGRVGYETYMGKAEDDCHDLIFGNMGPEVLNWVVKKPNFSLDDYFYFLMVDADPGCVFISEKSSMKTLDDVVAEGKKRTLTVATSRLAHPASLGMLVLANKTGMKVNLIPLSGGKNTRNGVLTGEVDLGVLPVTTAMGRKGIKVLGLFDERNLVPEDAPGAVLINTEYKLGIPPLAAGARAFGIKTAAAEKYPDRFDKLRETGMKVFTDPAYKEAVTKGKGSWALIAPGGIAECRKYVDNITALGQEYRGLLTG